MHVYIEQPTITAKTTGIYILNVRMFGLLAKLQPNKVKRQQNRIYSIHFFVGPIKLTVKMSVGAGCIFGALFSFLVPFLSLILSFRHHLDWVPIKFAYFFQLLLNFVPLQYEYRTQSAIIPLVFDSSMQHKMKIKLHNTKRCANPIFVSLLRFNSCAI